jgi:hypothetical protein
MMTATEYSNYKQSEGLIFRYTLTNQYLWLGIFGILPIAWVRLDRVENMRTSSSREFLELTPHRIFLWWKYWHWPYPLAMVGHRDKQVYVLKTRRGIRIFIRLRTGMHYMLRTLLPQAQA